MFQGVPINGHNDQSKFDFTHQQTITLFMYTQHYCYNLVNIVILFVFVMYVNKKSLNWTTIILDLDESFFKTK